MQLNNNNNNYKKKRIYKKRTSKGRQKISITKIQDKANLQVTFSKRRAGLFKKAGELCVLCGAKIAILVFSPKGKPYYFAHPDLNTVLNCYLIHEATNSTPFSSLSSSPSPSPSLDEEEKEDLTVANNPCFKEFNEEEKEDLTVANNPCFKEFNEEYEAALRDLEEEKKKMKNAKESDHPSDDGFWWDMVDFNELGLEELEECVNSLEELKSNVRRRMRQQMIDAFAAAASASRGGGFMGMSNLLGEQSSGSFGGGGNGVVYGFGFEGWQYF